MTKKSRHDVHRGDVGILPLIERMAAGHPLIMGILNVTPDSFSDGGRFIDAEKAVAHALKMEADGADLIDIGGESTRPGASAVDLKDELKRVLPVMHAIRQQSRIPISIDTTKSQVARAALDAGVEMINDVTFGDGDPEMFDVVADYPCLYTGMHMQGTPRNMQDRPLYADVVKEVGEYLEDRADLLAGKGFAQTRIVIDPGIGFGKSDAHNLSLLRKISELKRTGYRLMIGTSRKSMFGRLMNLDVEERLIPSVISAVLAVRQGADIVRVHDVAETRMALQTADLICE